MTRRKKGVIRQRGRHGIHDRVDVGAGAAFGSSQHTVRLVSVDTSQKAVIFAF